MEYVKHQIPKLSLFLWHHQPTLHIPVKSSYPWQVGDLMTRWPKEIQANVAPYEIKRSQEPTWHLAVEQTELQNNHIQRHCWDRTREWPSPTSKLELLGWDWEQWGTRLTWKSCSEGSLKTGILSHRPGTELGLSMEPWALYESYS